MSQFDLTPTEGEVWREFKFSTKAVIAELLRVRQKLAKAEAEVLLRPKLAKAEAEVLLWEYNAGIRGR